MVNNSLYSLACLLPAKLVRILFAVFFILCSLQLQAKDPVTTAEGALKDLTNLETKDLLGILNQTKGDEAWTLTTGLVDKLRASESFSLPCMTETATAMKNKTDAILAEAQWLETEDREGFSDFLKHLDKLKSAGFPYRESVVAPFIFASLLQYYFDKKAVLTGPPEKTAPKKKKPNIQTIKELNASMMAVYQEKQNDPEKAIGEYEHDAFSNYHTMLDNLFENNKVFWPVFSPLTIDDLNFMHHLPLVPVGFLLTSSERHDGFSMNCNYFPYHDLDHERYQVCSNLPQAPEEKEVKHQEHRLVQSIYHYFKADNASRTLQIGIRLSLFNSLHERGSSIYDLGDTHSDYKWGILRPLADLEEKLAPDEKYSDLPEAELSLLQDTPSWVIKAGLWWCALYSDRKSKTDPFSIDFASVTRESEELEAKLKKQITFIIGSNSTIQNNIRKHIIPAYCDSTKTISKGFEALCSPQHANYAWYLNHNLCFWLALPPPDMVARWAWWRKGYICSVYSTPTMPDEQPDQQSTKIL